MDQVCSHSSFPLIGMSNGGKSTSTAAASQDKELPVRSCTWVVHTLKKKFGGCGSWKDCKCGQEVREEGGQMLKRLKMKVLSRIANIWEYIITCTIFPFFRSMTPSSSSPASWSCVFTSDFYELWLRHFNKIQSWLCSAFNNWLTRRAKTRFLRVSSQAEANSKTGSPAS